jgi:hypothetical protein
MFSVKTLLEKIIVKRCPLFVESSHCCSGILRIKFSVFLALPFKGLERLEQIN